MCLHSGDAEDIPLIGVEACVLHSGGDTVLIGVPAVGSSLDQLPASPLLATYGLLQRVLLDIICPGGQRIDLAENVGDLRIFKKRRFCELILCKLQIRFGALPALGFRLAESAPLATVEFAFPLVVSA